MGFGFRHCLQTDLPDNCEPGLSVGFHDLGRILSVPAGRFRSFFVVRFVIPKPVFYRPAPAAAASFTLSRRLLLIIKPLHHPRVLRICNAACFMIRVIGASGSARNRRNSDQQSFTLRFSFASRLSGLHRHRFLPA
jgi:hypothetical protein